MKKLEVDRTLEKSAHPCFRLLTGHDCMRSHHYRIGIADSPDCNLCDYNHSTSGRVLGTKRLCVVEKYWKERTVWHSDDEPDITRTKTLKVSGGNNDSDKGEYKRICPEAESFPESENEGEKNPTIRKKDSFPER
ncbi:hypothetical protein TNCV_3077121 [Trichonephila clavipes]|nr:hypothetical protein TNCV_3077121 [Trichonephila clavipes]